MTQRDIDQAVARVLGEAIANIETRGFSLLQPEYEYFDAEYDSPAPQVVDWDGPNGEPTVGSFYEFAA